MAAPAYEELLVAVGRHRDRAAFAELFAHFAPRLKTYLTRIGSGGEMVEEVVQEAMLMVWRRAETFDPAQASASTWIFTIARNKRIDALRRVRRPEIDPEDPALVPDAPKPADEAMAESQRDAAIKRVLKTLPEEQAALLRQAYFEDKSHSTIAAESDLPLGTVKSRIRLALAKLRQGLERELT
ncbi:MAG: sigma-70 family RNA polymerase sigma factor [Alphaproteobacteria bacterium]|nr:sigma-70 family RNA polymerase sigma factor [Alphaproteobacteria bacterium]MBU0798284.1 sigma-70 family RNA polymerase sigma factor [Alphaproteobacteria bacterium]MBU0889138.1 sigma-70 family RNA polymerase sigma factor [Alphaproteobacteria bacterium]MBU1812172.1 sigma-70 family RNA polymerase sigma factor [Alphaproteobacteria bacterium]